MAVEKVRRYGIVVVPLRHENSPSLSTMLKSGVVLFLYQLKKGKNMARPIKETPILFGEDARRFEARMQQVRKETPEEKQARMEAYNMVMKWFENGKKYEDELRAAKGKEA